MGGERKYNVDDDFFENESYEKYWLIGLLASDGSVRHNQISLSQSGEHGRDMIEYVKRLLKADAPMYKSKTTCQDSFSIQISSEKIVRDLSFYNILENKTLTYKMPYIPDQYFASFIAGYVEGDGCITLINPDKNRKYKYLHTSFVGTEAFMRACYEKIPIRGKFKKHSQSSVYEIRYDGQKAVNFCDWIYQSNNLYHGRKYDIYLQGKSLFENSRKERYKKIKASVLSDLRDGVEDIMKYSKTIKIPFQTIYSWKKKWITEGLL